MYTVNSNVEAADEIEILEVRFQDTPRPGDIIDIRAENGVFKAVVTHVSGRHGNYKVEAVVAEDHIEDPG